MKRRAVAGLLVAGAAGAALAVLPDAAPSPARATGTRTGVRTPAARPGPEGTRPESTRPEEPAPRAGRRPRERGSEARRAKRALRDRIANIERCSSGHGLRVAHPVELIRLVPPPQRERIAAILDRGRRRVRAVLELPFRGGPGVFQARVWLREAVRHRVGSGRDDRPLEPRGDIAAILEARDARVPGRAETYGEAIARILAEVRAEVGQALSEEQQGSWFGRTRLLPGVVDGCLDPARVLLRAKRAAHADRD